MAQSLHNHGAIRCFCAKNRAIIAPCRIKLRHHLHKIGRTSHAHTPAGTYSRAIFNRLLIDLSWASSQFKAAMETQMILNHKSAIELLVDNVETAQFDRYMLMNLHAILSENLLPHRADEGRIRQYAVEIGKSVFRPLAVPQELNDQLTLLLDTVNQITDPFEQCFFILVHLPYLQPFADINKRTSRLLANLPLFRANLCPLTFLDVPESAYSRAMLGVYELTRVELLRDVFVWAYERSTREYLIIRQELAEPDPLRLSHRSFIRDTVHAVVVEELHHLHEGVLARYALRPSEFHLWKAHIASSF
jgi:fido (protein-threonine AMPylation protein)